MANAIPTVDTDIFNAESVRHARAVDDGVREVNRMGLAFAKEAELVVERVLSSGSEFDGDLPPVCLQSAARSARTSRAWS